MPNDDFSGDDLNLATEPSPAAFASFGDEQTLVTKEGLRKLIEELEYLKTTRRQEVAQRLKEAISYGDLSENSEYEEAKNEQAFVEGRILELEHKVKNAKIITDKKETHKNVKEIEIGSTVTVRNRTKRSEEPEIYTIVGATEADPVERKISNESPMGKAFLGKQKDDVVDVHAPGGVFKYEILRVA